MDQKTYPLKNLEKNFKKPLETLGKTYIFEQKSL